MKIRFEIPGQPVGKARPRVCLRGGFAHAYTPSKTKEYEDLVRLSFKLQTNTKAVAALWNKPLCINIEARFKLPRSFTKAECNAALNGKLWPQTKPDWDNISKIICDALNNLAYKDDSCIVKSAVEKVYSEEQKVIVEIQSLEEETR